MSTVLIRRLTSKGREQGPDLSAPGAQNVGPAGAGRAARARLQRPEGEGGLGEEEVGSTLTGRRL